MVLVLPRSGSAATAFYRTFPSEAIARWMSELLSPGMTVVDVGAHVGVYSMLAGRLVGPSGQVHAIEPQRECAALLDRNRALNSLTNLETHALALSDSDGEIELLVDRRTMGGFAGSLLEGETDRVSAHTLAGFATGHGLQRIDLLKLDAAGNEDSVLRGAGPLLDGRIGNVICKLYNPRVTAERFGSPSTAAAVVDALREHRYRVELADGRPADASELERIFAGGEYSVPALARA
jgi:FkbM family methyltransferase